MADEKQVVRLTMISFRVDDEALTVLKKLEEAVGQGIVSRRRRSIAIRKALLEAGDRLERSIRK
jgi:hypothetical protein